MTISRTLNFIFIIAGGFIALYAKADEGQNVYLLMVGIVLLMMGLYRTSRNLSSRKPDVNNLTDKESIEKDEF